MPSLPPPCLTALQAVHTSAHPESQQKPSTQNPRPVPTAAHSVDAEHAAPMFFFWTH